MSDGIRDSKRIRQEVRQYMELRMPQWRERLAPILADPRVSDEDAWHEDHTAAYVLARDAQEMVEHGEIRTHGDRRSEWPADVLAFRAPLLRRWRQESIRDITDPHLPDQEAFGRLHERSYALLKEQARWLWTQHDQGAGERMS